MQIKAFKKNELFQKNRLPGLLFPRMEIEDKKEKTPHFKKVVAHIHNSWIALKGFGYPFVGRDFKDLKNMCRIFQPWGVCALWDTFVASESEWIKNKSGYSISSFCRCLPWLVDDPNWKKKAKDYEMSMVGDYPQEIMDLLDESKFKII